MTGLRYVSAVAAVVVCCASGSDASRKDMELQWHDSTYEVTHSFDTDCPLDTLYAIIHRPDHVRMYLKRANLEIEVLDSSANWNKLRYTYKYYISRLILTFSRRIVPDSQAVAFSLVASVSTGTKVIPRVTEIDGVYRVVDSAGVQRVDYWQRTSLDRNLNRLYLFFIKRDTWRSLRDLKAYIEELRSGGALEQ